MSSTTRPRSNSSASAAPGESMGWFIAVGVRKTGEGRNGVTSFEATGQRMWNAGARGLKYLHARKHSADPSPLREVPLSIPIRLDIQERERTKDMGQVGRRRRVHVGFVKFGEVRDA